MSEGRCFREGGGEAPRLGTQGVLSPSPLSVTPAIKVISLVARKTHAKSYDLGSNRSLQSNVFTRSLLQAGDTDTQRHPWGEAGMGADVC